MDVPLVDLIKFPHMLLNVEFAIFVSHHLLQHPRILLKLTRFVLYPLAICFELGTIVNGGKVVFLPDSLEVIFGFGLLFLFLLWLY